MSENLEKFFTEYGAAFDKPEVTRKFYGDSSITSAPEGVFCLKGDEEFEHTLKEVSDYQKKTGMKSLTPSNFRTTTIDDRHLWTRLTWNAIFEKTGDKPVQFDISYLLRKTDGSFQIVAYVAHDSETEMRKELGID